MQNFDLFDELIKVKEIYRDKHGIMRKRSKYLRRAHRVLYFQRIFVPPPKLIIDKSDLPKRLLIDPYLNAKVNDFARRLFEVINEEIYADVKDLIRTVVQ